MHQERINFIQSEDGTYCGYSVNLPMIVGQAESLDDLKVKMKELGKTVLEHLQEIFNQEEPFEFKELTPEEWFKPREK